MRGYRKIEKMPDILLDIMPSGSWGSLSNGLKNDVYYPLNYLCWCVSAICGLVGALRIYKLWNIHSRHHIHIDTQVVAWIGAAIFFILANTFIKIVLMV